VSRKRSIGARRIAVGVFALLAAAGCTKAPGGATEAPVETCTKANQTCRYAEGKIGLCTPSSAPCNDGGACLVCMSLH
jgi:hypothetical protein